MYESPATGAMHSQKALPAVPANPRSFGGTPSEIALSPQKFIEVFEQIRDLDRRDVIDEDATISGDNDLEGLDVSLSDTFGFKLRETTTFPSDSTSLSPKVEVALRAFRAKHDLEPGFRGPTIANDVPLTSAELEAMAYEGGGLGARFDADVVGGLRDLSGNFPIFRAEGPIPRLQTDLPGVVAIEAEWLETSQPGDGPAPRDREGEPPDILQKDARLSEVQAVQSRGTAGASGTQTMVHVAPHTKDVLQVRTLSLDLSKFLSKSDLQTLKFHGAVSAKNASEVAQIETGHFVPGRAVARSVLSLPQIPPLQGLDQTVLGQGLNFDGEMDHADQENDLGLEFRLAASQDPLGAKRNTVIWHRAELPAALAQQIEIAVRESSNGKPSVELLLSPDDLGRVRLNLIPNEGVMTVNLLADRPETLELLRRHIDSLSRALLEIGYERTEFSFGGQGHGQGAPNGSQAPSHDRKGFSQEAKRGSTPSSLAEMPSATPPKRLGQRLNVLI